jgi:pimeloyl-ACP methyl ester carboxylesterase
MIRHKRLLAAVSALAIGAGFFAADFSFFNRGSVVSTARADEAPSYESLVSQTKDRWAKLGFETHIIKINGVDLHVAMAGQGDPVVLLHGYPQSGEVWRFVAPELAKTHRVIIPDLRGMGLSEVAKGGYDLSNVAEDIHQLVRSLGYNKVKVAGHDWGGAVGATYALRYRDEVTKLAFLESALAGAGFEDLWTFTKPNGFFTFIPFLLMGEVNPSGDITAELVRGHEEIFMRHLWIISTGDKQASPFSSWTPYIAVLKRPGLVASGASYYRSAYESADENRTLLATGKLTIPVLAIAGEKSIGVHHEQLVRNFAANVTQNIVLTGAGHFVAEERPADVTSAISAFLTN